MFTDTRCLEKEMFEYSPRFSIDTERSVLVGSVMEAFGRLT